MLFNAPNTVSRAPGDHRSLWRRLFMEALDGYPPTTDSVSHALHAAALLTGASVMDVVDSLVDLGLRAEIEAFPKAWILRQQGRVLDLASRQLMSFAEASLAARWGWMLPPPPRLYLPPDLCAEQDPFGADLFGLFAEHLGPLPRFGYRPAHVRLSLLRLALGMGRPLAEVVSALITRGFVAPPEVIPAGCREHLRLTTTHPLVQDLLASWKASQKPPAQIIPLRSVR